MSEDKYKRVARIIVKACRLPFPVSDTLLEILKYLIEEDELDFIMAFKLKKSQTIEELKRSSKLSDEEIIEKVQKLASKGIIFNQPNSK